MKGSWRTTVAGVVAFLSVLFGELNAAMDSDPETVANWNLVVAAGGVLYGLWKARDNAVTSEKAGAK
jgi:hypothetical protein